MNNKIIDLLADRRIINENIIRLVNEDIKSIPYKKDEDVFDTFTENGLFYSGYSQAESLLSPSSEMRDWTKFFKRGDVVIKDGGGMAAVFDGWANDTYTEFNTTVNLYCDNNTGEEEVCTTLLFRKATEEERNQFIEKVERILKGKYNPDTLQVEPIKPECPFKPFGEKIKIKLEEIKELIEEYENEVQ